MPKRSKTDTTPHPLSLRKKSAYGEFRERWQGGCGSSLCGGARRKVFARGQVPCDILFVGEGPGECCSGDTLIEVAFRDKGVYPNGIPIKDLAGKKDFQVYSYDVYDRKIVLGNVRRVWCTGMRTVYRVSYFWWGGDQEGGGGRQKYYGSIEVTNNHPFLLKSGRYMSIRGGLTVGDRLRPFYRRPTRYHLIGDKYNRLFREARFLMESKLGRKLDRDEEVHHRDRNKWNDTEGNLELIDRREHARLHGLEDNAMFNPEHRKKHKEVMDSEEYRAKMRRIMGDKFKDPEMRRKRTEQNKRVAHKTSSTLREKYKDPVFYYNYLRNRRFKDGSGLTEERIEQKFREKFPDVEYPPEGNHEIYKIEKVGVKAVYDMEVDEYHNFAANGVFVHNSEDVTGIPFCGPAGSLLDLIVERALGQSHPWRVCFTNVVACIPRDDDGDKVGEPADEDVRACTPRLQEFVRLCEPRLIVAVGTTARDWLDRKRRDHVPLHRDIPIVDIQHPSFILRSSLAARNLLVQRAVVGIRTAVEDHLESE